MRRWHLGVRYPVRKGWRWSNRWVTHPCHDLALPFEVGARAYHEQQR